jgi:hypothetical protein
MFESSSTEPELGGDRITGGRIRYLRGGEAAGYQTVARDVNEWVIRS